MQFHLDGYRPGDPAVADPIGALPPPVPERPLPSDVDVLIVGCGPTGLTLAAQLSAFPDIAVAIADLKSGPLQVGQADGIAVRSMEMFNAFGFAERIQREAYWVTETVFWRPDPDDPKSIRRADRIQDVEDGLSEFPHVILNQARVHDHFLETMRNSPTGLTPHYSRRLAGLERPSDDDTPVVARFERIGPDREPVLGTDGESEIEEVRARYVVGCDGARSSVRRLMGRTLRGDAANKAWGVMDVFAVTDFPDIRFKAIVHSANQGNLLVIPREGGYMFRLYIELDKLDADERVADRNITIDYLIAAGQRILAPYTLEVKEVAWWSVYEIGQRLTDRFDDVGLDDDDDGDTAIDERLPRVFIAGDACHTHSPKAGQGMNVSMRDSFNLGWKLAAVLRGQARPELLHTYTAERQGLAKLLIDFDRKLATMFSAPPKTTESGDDDEAVDPAEFQRYFQQQGHFTAGTATTYSPSMIVGEPTNQHLAHGFEIGTRFHSARVVRLADAKPVHLGHTVTADGRWRLFAFADAAVPDDPDSRLAALCAWLTDSSRSPVIRYTPSDGDIDSVIDVRGVVQRSHADTTIGQMPPILRPMKGRLGLVDYEKVFCPDFKEPGAGGRDIFDQRGVDREAGALVVVRPDQHVAHVLPLDGYDELTEFFDRFMIPAS
ncbi:MAG: FAD-binding monooxygenase [Acidimicrobiia bacterium]|nr:FAD-binding monooxygenase [Acidimicrobiia bacterium]